MATRWLVPLVLIGHLALVLPLAALLNIWADETYSLHTTSRDVAYALDQATHFEVQPPLYFIMLTLWRTLSPSLLWARLFSVTCSALTLVVVNQLARRLWPERHPAWCVAAVACHPFFVWAAVEARVYALTVLCSSLMVLWFFEGYWTETPRPKARWQYWLVVVVGLYVQYYLGFLAAAQVGVLLLLRRWQAFLQYLRFAVVAGVAILPLLWLVFVQTHTHSYLLHGALPLLDAADFLWKRVFDFALPAEWPPLIGVRDLLLSGSALFVMGWCWRKSQRTVWSERSALWIMAALLTLCFIVVATQLGWKELMGRRHTAALFLPVLCAVFSVMAAAPKKVIFPLWALVLLCFNGVTLAYEYRKMAKLGDWDRVAQYVMHAEKPGQTILIFPGEWEPSFVHHYQGSNRVVALPRGETFQTYDLRKFVLYDEQDILGSFSMQSRDMATVWLVSYDSGSCETMGIHFGCEVLNDFIQKYYFVEIDRTFFSSRVRLLRRQSEVW